MKRILLAAVLMTGITGAALGSELKLYNWSNYIPPGLLLRFEQETGIQVSLETYDSNEALLARLRSGAPRHDVVVPSDYTVRVLIDEGLAAALNAQELPNFENVRRPHHSPPFDPQRRYSAPYMWGTTGLAYDSAQAPALEASWKEFFEPRESLRGLIVSLNDPVDTWNAAAHYLSIDTCSRDPADAERILAMLRTQRTSLAMYSSLGIIERMAAGEVAMHHAWNGAAHRARRTRGSIRYLYPKEGLDMWGDHLLIPADAPNPGNARKFINWMMMPRNAAEASNFTGYMNAIRGSEAFLEEDLKSDPAINMPAEYAGRLRPTRLCSTATAELRDHIWSRLQP